MRSHRHINKRVLDDFPDAAIASIADAARDRRRAKIGAVRRDVRAILDQMIVKAPPVGSRGWWRFYYACKRRISEACGWHAPTGAYDQKQFDLAIQTLLREPGYYQ